ncbi:hypothetical protein Rt10032_c12g4790 [Rhodotorula toruloides]|uniref:Uncharacterized protein n=1 Tax=Rhodotorula toruloides TaxID=5286 RepID=A0A511KK84_RHOTO|nr:hypothetical protein Rt10032_c12g4790 [Rhodotorula toruloides]
MPSLVELDIKQRVLDATTLSIKVETRCVILLQTDARRLVPMSTFGDAATHKLAALWSEGDSDVELAVNVVRFTDLDELAQLPVALVSLRLEERGATNAERLLFAINPPCIRQLQRLVIGCAKERDRRARGAARLECENRAIQDDYDAHSDERHGDVWW